MQLYHGHCYPISGFRIQINTQKQNTPCINSSETANLVEFQTFRAVAAAG